MGNQVHSFHLQRVSESSESCRELEKLNKDETNSSQVVPGGGTWRWCRSSTSDTCRNKEETSASIGILTTFTGNGCNDLTHEPSVSEIDPPGLYRQKTRWQRARMQNQATS